LNENIHILLLAPSTFNFSWVHFLCENENASARHNNTFTLFAVYARLRVTAQGKMIGVDEMTTAHLAHRWFNEIQYDYPPPYNHIHPCVYLIHLS
jgi:hypothetical protein